MTPHLNRRAATVALVVILSIGAFAHTRADDTPDISSHPWIGEMAPDFKLKTVAGGELSLEDLRGRYVVIHFGASW